MMARMSRELKHMLDTATDGAFAVDAAQIIIYWNKAATRILGYVAAEVTGRSCFAVLCGHDDLGHTICKKHCTISAAALGGQAVPGYNLAARTRSGQVRWINISILTLPAAANAPPMVIHLFRDATQTKQNEQFIQQVFALAKRDQKLSTLDLPPPQINLEPLTGREQDVLNLLNQGHSTHSISQALSISSSTVRNHIQKILHKFGVHSRLEAVAVARKHGLLPEE